MISDEMGTRSRHQSGGPSDEVVGFEQHVSGAIGEGVFQFVDHQPIAIDAQALLNTALDTFRRSFAQEESRRLPMFNEQYAYGFRVPKN